MVSQNRIIGAALEPLPRYLGTKLQMPHYQFFFSGHTTTSFTTFHAHWIAEHHDMKLTDALLDNVVGLGVNPLYHHNTRRGINGEFVIRPLVDCPLRRTAFDARIQVAFQHHCIKRQQDLVDSGVGLFFVVTHPSEQSRQSGCGLAGTFDRQLVHFMTDEDSSATSRRSKISKPGPVNCRPPFGIP